jgi:hypothetical protein
MEHGDEEKKTTIYDSPPGPCSDVRDARPCRRTPARQ